MSRPPRSPLVVTGMHRSGTSLLASLLDAAGVDLGRRLIGPGPGNPRGHFEDAELVAFHTALLRRHDPSGLALWLPPERLEVAGADRRGARVLGEARARPSPWGWKDPRTVLFLDLWREVFPEALFLFVLREPACVLDSLRARRDRRLMLVVLGRSLSPSGRRRGLFRYRRALDSWLAYHRRILSFVRRFPEQCMLVQIEELVHRPEPVLDRIAQRSGVPVGLAELRRVYEPALLGSVASWRGQAAVAARSDVPGLRAELRALAASGT